MTQNQLLTAIEKKTAPVIVDVRSQSEYESGHVPGAMHLPFYAMWSRHSEIKAKPENHWSCIASTDHVLELRNSRSGPWDTPTSYT